MRKDQINKEGEYFDCYGTLFYIGAKVVYAPSTGGYIRRGHVIKIDDKGVQCEWERVEHLDICKVCGEDAQWHWQQNPRPNHYFQGTPCGVKSDGKGRPNPHNMVIVTGWPDLVI